LGHHHLNSTGYVTAELKVRRVGELSRMVAEFDWAATPIGGRESWPQSLRSIASLCLASPLPMNVIWGLAHIQIYNDAHARLLGADHPGALGTGFLDNPGDIDTDALLAAWSGQPHLAEDQPFYPFHDGMPHENFRTVSFAPVQSEGGDIGGVVQSTLVTTPAVISPRRGLAMRDLTRAMAQSRTEVDIIASAGRVMSERPQDFPFVLFYLPVTDGSGGYRLAGSIGVPPGAAAAPGGGSSRAFARCCRTALALMRRRRSGRSSCGRS
jgi:hypothetical protein